MLTKTNDTLPLLALSSGAFPACPAGRVAAKGLRAQGFGCVLQIKARTRAQKRT